MRKFYVFVFTIILYHFSLSQNRFFSFVGENVTRPTNGKREIKPQKYAGFTADISSLRAFLWSLPEEKNINHNRDIAPVMEIPMPDGSMARFRVWESSIMSPGLQAKFPQMKQFLGQGIDDPYASIRFDYNPFTGFHAQILSAKTGRIFIDPYAKGDLSFYMSYYTKDYTKEGNLFECEVTDYYKHLRPEGVAAPCLGTSLRTYRLALACTGEYAIAVCAPNPPNVPQTAAAMATSVNRVVGVYETEVSVRMVLVPDNNNLIFLDPNTDPYTNNNGTAMLAQNQTTIDAIIGSANYDIGHVFSTGGGGIAGLGVVCVNGQKARGVTGQPQPWGDPFDIDYVAHEMGHQYGANHTMAGCGSSPIVSKKEPGSGTTIMAYAGICGTENIQPNSDPFFHAYSFDEISNFISTGNGSTCAQVTPTGNNVPVINALPNNGVTIPISTPFTLTATASDPDGHPITYCWEQWDNPPSGNVPWNAGATAPPGNTVPLFKSRIPKTIGERTFPDIQVILAGYPPNPPPTMGGLKGETLSPVSRSMTFKVTVRDNRAGGGGVASSGSNGCQTSSPYVINVAGTQPFTVTSPNGGESYPALSSQTVTWNVAGTDAAPFNVSNVRILLSTDGGVTYPTVVVASTPNDGSETVTIPNVPPTTQARVKIEAIGNVFFDISNNNFTITLPVSGFSFNNPAPASSSCPAPASMSITLNVISTGGFSNPVTLSASGNPSGTTVSFSANPVTPTPAPGTPITVSLNGTNTLSAGTYVIAVTGTASGAPNQTVNLSYIINTGPGPTITGQPSNQTICAGTNTSFSITSPSATSFQWQVSTDGGTTFNNVTNGGVYSGATTSTLSLSSVPTGFNGYRYRCIASIQCGSTTSSVAVLTVNAAPAITTQPQNSTICAGTNTSFSVSATGAGLSYQWQENTGSGFVNVTNGGVYSGATTATLQLSGVPATMNGYRYRCVVSGTCSPAATSSDALLTVVAPVSVTQQPSNATTCDGGNASFTAVGSGTGVIYQWQVNTGSGFVNVTNGGVYSGATTATLTITGATLSMNGYQYRCLMSNAVCTSPTITNAATLTVNTLPNISSNPSSVTICTGSNTSFSVTASGTGITYQWQVNTGSGFTNLTDGGVYSGTSSPVLNLNGPTSAFNGYQYRCVVSGVCPPQATSAAATLTVINPVTITSQPANREICSGSNTSFSITATSTEPISYQWQVSTDGGTTWTNISGATAATLSLTNVPVSLNGNRYRCQVRNVTCTAPVNSNSALLNVRQLPTITLNAAPLTELLPGKTTTLTAAPSAPTGGVQAINWLFNNNPITNSGNTRVVNVEQVGTYKVTIQETFPSGLVCSNQSADVVITAKPSDKLFIFPNPNDGRFTVSYYNASGAPGTRRIVVFDAKGAMIYDKQFNIAGPYTLMRIDLRNAGRGIHMLMLGDGNGTRIIQGKVHIR
ncbi:MAG: M12 family metallo-peptidase [Chitinophagaceae bacterium]|nr:M12 family metallo-peptidase [Chitinophagaceae bacterium]